MSRRTRQYRVHMRGDVAATAEAIMHAHRLTTNAGRRYDSMMDIAENRYTSSSLPIKPEKAHMIARTLHAGKRA